MYSIVYELSPWQTLLSENQNNLRSALVVYKRKTDNAIGYSAILKVYILCTLTNKYALAKMRGFPCVLSPEQHLFLHQTGFLSDDSTDYCRIDSATFR